ncbi:MAG: class I SAM-dependent RNA methyltransferase [Sphaerochaeta sp.]|nr:class I SAM-dependent RNA methyltransferase [Sphaerochaeta sp.]
MQVSIEKLVQGGKGFARLDSNKSLFVEEALPGEVVEILINEEKKGYAKAQVTAILQASDDRVTPPCRYWGICGGCDLQHLASEKQPGIKQKMVLENLERIGSIPASSFVLEETAFAKSWAYRSRVRFHVDMATREIGFLAKRSNNLVPITTCPILVDALNVELARKDRILSAARSLMFSSKTRTKRYVEVNAFAGDKKVSFGDEVVTVTVDGHLFYVTAHVFFQSNLLLLPDLVRYVSEHVQGSLVMDLYSGVGTFSSFLASPKRSLIAVERQKECLALAKRNVPGLEVYTDSVELWAKRRRQNVDTVVVDPPRTGLDEGLPALIASWKAKRVIYVSCDSVTLGRDLQRFMMQGYTVSTVKVFDLYPQTFHQEVVVILDREEHTL